MKFKQHGLKRKVKSKEKIEEEKEQSIRDREFYEEIWRERPHYSQISGKWLGNEINRCFFDHLVEKSVRNDLRYEKKNIILLTADEHTLKTNGFPLPKHIEYIEEAKRKFLN